MNIELLNKWIGIYSSFQGGDKKAAVDFEQLANASEKAGLLKLMDDLFINHYIGRTKDGNIFIAWTSNKFYPEATIRNLKVELKGKTHPATVEEQLKLLQVQFDTLNREVKRLKRLLEQKDEKC